MSFKLEWKKIIICFVAVFGMGFCLSFLIMCDLGTDPCTFMNRSVSDVIGISFGTWQLIVNIVMLAIVIMCKRSLIGFGTIFNMVLIGYYADFFCWLWKKIIPAEVFVQPETRYVIFGIMLLAFIISVAVYISVDMGVSPYDGLPVIITGAVLKRRPRVSGALLRILWDGSALGIGMLAGGTPTIGNVLMVLFLGPVISVVRQMFEKFGKTA